MSVLRVYTDHDVTNLLFTTDNKEKMAANTLMSCGIAAAFPSVLASSKSKFATSGQLPAVCANASSRFSMSADWMPGQPRPPYLDGSAPG